MEAGSAGCSYDEWLIEGCVEDAAGMACLKAGCGCHNTAQAGDILTPHDAVVVRNDVVDRGPNRPGVGDVGLALSEFLCDIRERRTDMIEDG